MRFQVLGPLEVVVDGRPVRLGGVKQRATLGFLLLHANRVIATSQLLRALWADEMPATARKMLQNAVSGIRRVIIPGGAGSDGAGSDVADVTALLTHAPGYLLRVPLDSVDLVCFQRLAERGRAELAAGSWQSASGLLREALALWRGPALTDLVEAGIAWPELVVVENSRLAALEDCIEAELALGRHHEVVGELEALVGVSPPRERLCGHMMLALYRCGRQADALSVYRRTRSRLVEGLGLEPGRALRELEGAILNHDPALDLAAASRSRRRRTTDLAGHAPSPAGGVSAGGMPEEVRRASSREPAAEHKLISVILLLVQSDPSAATSPAGDDPDDVAEARRDVAAVVHAEVERLGGIVSDTVGPIWSMLFGADRTREDDAARAVRAAFAVQRRLDEREPEDRAAPGAAGTTAHSSGVRQIAQIAVATGEALVTWAANEATPDDSASSARTASAVGGVFDRCMRLLLLAPPGEMRVCDTTRRASELAIAYDGTRDRAQGWRVLALERRNPGVRVTAPFVDRDRELDMLRGLLEQVRRRRRPHLFTVLGEPGIGKSRLVVELGRLTEDFEANRPDKARFLVGRPPRTGGSAAAAVLADIVRTHAGIQTGDSAAAADEKLTQSIHRLVGPGNTSAWLSSCLRPVVGLGERPRGKGCTPETLAAGQRIIAEIASRSPLVLVIEDLHRADDTLLDFVEGVTERSGPVPLFVIVTARAELLERRPDWGGGKLRSTTITLDPLPDAAIMNLLGAVCAARGQRGRVVNDPETYGAVLEKEMTSAFRGALFARIGGNPLFAQEYARVLGSGARTATATAESWAAAGRVGGVGRYDGVDVSRLLPQRVYSVIASRLDALPAGAKAVLRDAAVLGDPMWAGAVAAVGRRRRQEVIPWLEYLEFREFLQRSRRNPSASETEYSFQHVVVRDVAYSQIPRSVRIYKHRLAAAWIENLPGDHAELVARHRRAIGFPHGSPRVATS
jgi:DNA-binding SARP family transcriptional activator